MGTEYTVIKRGKHIITLNYFLLCLGLSWECEGICFKAIILRPNPVLAVF